MALSARDRDVLGYAVRHGMVTADQLGARFFASTPVGAPTSCAPSARPGW